MKIVVFCFKISLKFASKGPVNNYTALVQIMAWHWTVNRPLSEAVMVDLVYWCIHVSLGLNELTCWPLANLNEILYTNVIFKWILVIDGWGITCEIALILMSLDFTDNQSTLVQVMAWCRQATSHYLSQCWPRSALPFGITGPQWVNVWGICHCRHDRTLYCL